MLKELGIIRKNLNKQFSLVFSKFFVNPSGQNLLTWQPGRNKGVETLIMVSSNSHIFISAF